MPERIVTCCYCGRHAELADVGHGLGCASCGAPLRRMKALRPAQARAVASHPANDVARPMPSGKRGKKRPKKKKSKGFFAEFLEEVFDEIEDIFD